MSKVLIVTVGGSPQPIITSVKTLKADRVIFICTDGQKGSRTQVTGQGKPCEIRKGGEIIKKLPNLPTTLNLDTFNPDRDMILIQEPDDASECYIKSCNTIRALLETYDSRDIMADYTGGTKSMSMSLGMAAMDYNISLYLTTSIRRQNLIGVEGGESTELVSTSLIDVERRIKQFLPVYLKNYQYPAAFDRLQDLLTSVQVPAESKNKIRLIRDCCMAFDAWDKFQHLKAWNLLQNFMGYQETCASGLFLKRVMESRGRIDHEFTAPAKMSVHGYEIVEDLVLNADRRASQERYDDAVSRLYRALELLVQIRLETQYSIKTGNVSLDAIPEPLKDKYGTFASEAKSIKLGLLQSYELLSAFPDDPLGKLYLNDAQKIQGVLNVRNNAILAHGFTPVTAAEYRKFTKIVLPFISTAVKKLSSSETQKKPVQFPVSFDLTDN